MPVTRQTLDQLDELRRSLDRIVDSQTRDLVRAWADAWSEVAPDLRDVLAEMLISGDRISRAQLLRSNRLRGALAVIASNLEELAAQAGVRVTGDLATVVEMAGSAQASVIDSQLPPGATQLVDLDAWSRVDPRQIDAIVRRTTEQVTSLSRPLSTEAYAAVRRELIRGVAAGSNPRETARRMVARVEGRFNGGLNRALVISRTETLDAHREAARVGQLQHRDVLTGWEWVAELDSRTCPACWSQHGSRYDATEPGPLGHQQCRCARVPRVKTWRELGFDLDEPRDLIPNARDRFASLSAAQQREVLGPRRYEAWRTGGYPMDEWARRRTTPGWRDSYVVSPAPSGGLAGSLAS